MVMVDSFPPPFTTHVSPSPAPITKSLKTNFQGRQESLEAPSGPQVERLWGKRERWAGEGEEMKWWENLEAGSTVWAEGDSEVKGSSPFMLNCE